MRAIPSTYPLGWFHPSSSTRCCRTGISQQGYLHVRPSCADLRHVLWIFYLTPGRRVPLRLPQARTQKLISAEDVQRQVALAVIVAVGEAPFLFPMQGKVGGVHIQHDFLRRRGVGFQEHLDQQLIDAVFPKRDLLIAMLIARHRLVLRGRGPRCLQRADAHVNLRHRAGLERLAHQVVGAQLLAQHLPSRRASKSRSCCSIEVAFCLLRTMSSR